MSTPSNLSGEPGESSPSRWPVFAFHATVGLVAAVFFTIFLFVPIPTLLANLADGAGYYLQIARHAAHGKWFTFDGVNPTNGFHPLWMIALVPVFKAVEATPEAYFRAAGLLVVGLLTLASFLFHRALRRMVPPLAAAVAGAGFLVFAFANLNLMESAIFLVFVAGLLLYGVSSLATSRITSARAFGFGLLLGGVILCRLDAGFLAVAIGVAGLAEVARATEKQDPLRVLVLVVLGACVVVLPYLLLNYARFGSPVPVSGRLESTFPHTDFRTILEGLASLGKLRLAILLFAMGYGMARIVASRGRPPRATPTSRPILFALDVLAATTLVHALNEVLFVRWRLYWHFVLLVPLFALLIAVTWSRYWPRISQVRRSGVLLLVCLAIAGEGAYAIRRMTSGKSSRGWRAATYEASLWIRANTAETDRVAAPIPEIVGFFSGRGVVDLSGLCNDLGIQKAMASQTLGAYLRASGVRYIFLSKAIPPAPGTGHGAFHLTFKSGYFGTPSEPLRISEEDEAYRSFATTEGDEGPSAYRLWRWQ